MANEVQESGRVESRKKNPKKKALKAESSPVNESNTAKAEPEAKLQVTVNCVPDFDPSDYIRKNYGPIAEPLSALKAILRELVILNHK